MATTVTSTITQVIDTVVTDACDARFFIEVQGSNLWLQANSQTYIDNLIDEVEGYITDIAVICYNPDVSPRVVLGESTLCNETSVSIGGLKPLTYLIQEANAVGINVWAWFVFMYSSNWCGTSSMLLDPIPNTDDYRTPGGIILYGVESNRTDMKDAVIDFCEQNSGLSGLLLDYIRTDGVVSQDPADITLLVQAIKAEMPVGMELGFFSLANGGALTATKQDGATWAQNGYADFCIAMNYNGAFWDRWDYLQDLADIDIIFGLSSVECENSASGYLSRMSSYRLRGHKDMNDFQWSPSGMYDAPNNFLDAIADYKNWVASSMGNITELTVTNWGAGGSFSFVVGGVTRTINYDDVTDHTTDYELKDHIEGLYGELPYLWFNNETAGMMFLNYGDRSEPIS